jgi:hypothetical protein
VRIVNQHLSVGRGGAALDDRAAGPDQEDQ